MPLMFAQSIGRVEVASDVVEGDHVGCNRLARVVARQSVVAL